MQYVIGVILLIIATIIIGLILRKRIYDTVDRLESWKLDIMNRNIASQLAQIKTLNLSGETQKKFNMWKERWEHIVTKELADVEEYLFDAEEAADKYRLPRAKKTLQKIDQTLQSVEADIEEMLSELDRLLEAEKESRKEIESIEPQIKELRHRLHTKRHHFGKADLMFEQSLNQLQEEIEKYYQFVETGDYSEAKQLVDQLKEKLKDFTSFMDEFPEILKTCEDLLPSQLDELQNGIHEMKNDGYHVDQFGFEEEIQSYKQRLQDCVTSLEDGKISDVKVIITEIEERIQEMYDLLEKEAIARNYLEAHFPKYEDALQELSATFAHTKAEIEELRQTYYLDDQDMERYLLLEQSMNQLKSELDQMSNQLANKDISHTELRSELESSFRQLDELKQQHDDFTNQIHNLRKDELEAKEQLTNMREQLKDVKRQMRKSNIPGVPSFIWTMIEDAVKQNKQVIELLNKQPLDMTEVQHALTESKSTVENVVEQTNLMIEQAYLTEQVIQYANRYRSQNPLLAAKLSESERLFRNYEYELALEEASQAIEEIEPGALKRIEAFYNENVIH